MFVNKFKVGADPEFIVTMNDKGVKASQVLHLAHEKVHYDHGGDVVECTPEPARSTFLLTKHINDILRDALNGIDANRIKFRGGAAFTVGNRAVTMGGHIHFERIPGVQANSALCSKALDNTTLTLEALDILPKIESATRRKHGMGNGYGALGDYRDGNNGKTIEYRTMCSWVHNPLTAFLCLTAGKLAVHAPVEVAEAMNPKNASYGNLEKLFRLFEDSDATRAVEKIFEKGVDLTAKLDTDFRKSWKGISQLYRRQVV